MKYSKKNLVLIFYKLENNIMSFIEYQWRENDHFMGPQPDLDLSEGCIDTYHRWKIGHNRQTLRARAAMPARIFARDEEASL